MTENALYLRLADLDQRFGLDPPRRLELARLQQRRGQGLQAAALVSDLACGEERAARVLWDPPGVASVGLPPGAARDLAEARVKLARGEYAAADAAFRGLLERGDVPWRLRHRVLLFRAAGLAKRNVMPEATQALQEGMGVCATDRDLWRAAAAFALGADGYDAVPETAGPVEASVAATAPGVRFLGGRAEFVGFAVERKDPFAYHLRLYWRFTGAVPVDLACVVQGGPYGGAPAWSRTRAFRDVDRTAFSAGAPCLGGVFTVDMPVKVPALPDAMDVLIIGLRGHGRRWLYSQEGLPRMAIWDWTKYADSDADRRPPERDAASVSSRESEARTAIRAGKA